MEFNGIVKFDDKIKIEDKIVINIYGEFNKDIGSCNVYYTTVDKTLVEEHKEEVQQQLDKAREDLNKKMNNENFLFNI